MALAARGIRPSPPAFARVVGSVLGEEVMAVTQCVLVVEDERKIRDLLRTYLEHDGLSVITTGSGAEAITRRRPAHPDLIVLDLRLPDVPGEDVAREVRTQAAIPILMLTAKTGTADRIHGLELGADDYVTKPFSPREVVLRVRAILRRAAGDAEADQLASYGGGQLLIDETRHQVTAHGQPAGSPPPNGNCSPPWPASRAGYSLATSSSTGPAAMNTKATSAPSTPTSAICAARSTPIPAGQGSSRR